MLRLQLKAETEPQARLERAALIRTLQEVTEDGLVPTVTLRREEDAFFAEVSYR